MHDTGWKTMGWKNNGWKAIVSAAALLVAAGPLSGCRLPGPGSADSSTTSSGTPTPTAVTTVRERVPVAALSSSTSAPACEYPSAPMTDGSRRMAPDEPGDVTLVIGADGNTWSLATTLSGEPDRLVRFDCSQGGVGWPEVLAVYVDSGEPVASLDLGAVDYPNGERYGHAVVVAATLSGDSVILRWRSYEGAGLESVYWTGILQLTDTRLEMTGVREG